MKNLLLVLLVSILNLSSANAMQWHCEIPNHDEVIQQSVERFMSEKLNVMPEDITHTEVLSSKRFLSRKTALTGLLLSPVILLYTEVVLYGAHEYVPTHKLIRCESKKNIKQKIRIEFNKGAQYCSVNLKVKVKLNNDDQVSTLVKQKYKPVCN